MTNKLNQFTIHNSLLSVKAIAFTLAETLIVMGIIGVVAALTLPNLNSSTGDKEKVAKVKKIYQNLNDAYGRMEAVYGPVGEWGSGGGNFTDAFNNRFTEFMKATYASSISSAEHRYYNLADGTTIDIIPYGVTYPNTVPGYTGCVIVYADIDGRNRGKNTYGNDIFKFAVDVNGTYANYGISGFVPSAKYGISYPSMSNDLKYSKPGSSDHTGHALWVIDFDNMDYLKAKSDGQTCPNGRVLNVTANPPVTSCN